MKDKIFKNKAVLEGLKFNVMLCNRFYEFKIMYVTKEVVNISIQISFRKIEYATFDSLEGIVKKTILETSANNDFPLNKQAYLCNHKLNNKEIVVDGIKLKMDYITTSKLTLEKSIEYDELLDSQHGTFLGTVKDVVLNNLVDNPPKPKKINSYGYVDLPYLFDSFAVPMHFQKLGHKRNLVSESELKKNREKFKEQRKKEEENRKKFEELEKELGLNKKNSTRNLARHR